MDTLLQYREESLAQVINEELITFMQNFNECFIKTVPLLMFPVNLGQIVTKCVRYHAAIYNLAAFYIDMNGKTVLVVCHYHHLRSHHRFMYSKNCSLSDEDSEAVDPAHLFFFINRSMYSLSSKKMKKNLGLYSKDINFNDNESSSAVASYNPYDSSTIALNQNEPESRQLPKVAAKFLLYADSSNPEVLPALQLPLLEEDLINEFSEEAQAAGDGPAQTAEGEKILDLKFLMDEAAESVIEMPILIQARFDYETHFDCFTKNELNTVVELYNIPNTYNTVSILQLYDFGCRLVKWCDDSHALLIFSRSDHANMALLMDHPVIQVRPMINASPIATAIACMIDFTTVLNYLHYRQRGYTF